MVKICTLYILLHVYLAFCLLISLDLGLTSQQPTRLLVVFDTYLTTLSEQNSVQDSLQTIVFLY